MRPQLKALTLLIPFFCAALIALGYGGAIHSYFASDDWLMLWYYGRMPVNEPWRFFSPEVVWFFRPLQNLFFGLFHTAFGFDPIPYNLALLLLHVAVAFGVYLLARELDSRPWFAGGVTALFLTQWAYADVLLWKSNANTLQWAVLTLASGICFLRSLETGRRNWRIAAFACGGLAFLAKEMAVNGPLLLGLLWAYRELHADDVRPGHRRSTVARAAKVLWPAFVLAVIYALFHRLCVRDIAEDRTNYAIVEPLRALKQMGFVYNHLLFSFYYDPVVVTRIAALEASVRGLVFGFLLTPVLLVLVGWRLRDRLLLAGTAWILISFLPVIFVEGFHASRFYYLPAFGAALILAQGAIRLTVRMGKLPSGARTMGLAAVSLVLLYWASANLARARVMVREDVQQAARVRSLFGTLQASRGKVAPDSLVVLQNVPVGAFGGGFGVREFVRLGLNDDTLEGVMQGQPLPKERLARLQQMRVVYSIDANAVSPALERVR